MKANSRRDIPSVDRILRELCDADIPRPALVTIIRRELAAIRQSNEPLSADATLARIRAAMESLKRSRIQPLINGTGILIHTNLGRSPMGEPVIQTLASIASNYNNLEYDLTDGTRGHRAAYLEHNLAVLCGAGAATVVNNGAAALILMLRHFVTEARPQVIISRGELVQIGGGFRIPDILEASGANLREVGTTNKTSLADYSRAITKQTALILKVHRSNFFMGGFVESPDTRAIAELARKKRIPFLEDLGSGATVRTESFAAGVQHEPTPAEVLKQGVDLVCFSGDKLLGGPQAGIIAGKPKLVAALKRDPFFRALRCDKLILAALQTTVDLHLRSGQDGARGQSVSSEIPILDMLQISEETLRARGEKLVADLASLPLRASLGTGQSQMGGGTLPRSSIPSVTLDLRIDDSLSLDHFAAKLRAGTPPVIAYIAGGRLKLDLRTIFPRQDLELVAALRAACTSPNAG
jgi:L-seryl-tRNA(Ser) seleniumtransferase